MSNYVWNRVVCSKSVLNTYFVDWFPFGRGEIREKPYISFNKLFNIETLAEYEEKVGVHVYYGFGDSWTGQPDGTYEIKFATRWEYPIQAILRTLELAHDVEWFAVEENHAYVSKFYWDNGIKEAVMRLEDAYYQWCSENEEFEEVLVNSDDMVWYYLQSVKENWKIWESDDNFERYRDKAAYRVICPF